MQQRISICREGWYYTLILGFVLVGALMRQINLLMILFGMMVGPLFFSWRLARATLRRLEVRRKLPAFATAGEPLVVELEVMNPRPRLPCWAVLVEDRLTREAGGPRRNAAATPVTARALFSYVPPRESRLAVYRGELPERGEYRFGPLQISTRFPLGLLQYLLRKELPDRLLVAPRQGRLLARWGWLQAASAGDMQQSQRKKGGSDGGFYGLRDWRAGDNRRWIHWRSSARRQDLVVRMFEQQRNQDLAIVLNLWQSDQPTAAELLAVETAVSFAATLLAELCRRREHNLVLVVAGRKAAFAQGEASAPLLRELLELLAMAQADPASLLTPALVMLKEQAGQAHSGHGSGLVVISTRDVDVIAAAAGLPTAAQWAHEAQTFISANNGLKEYFTLDQEEPEGVMG